MQLSHKNALNKVQSIHKVALNRVQILDNGRNRHTLLPADMQIGATWMEAPDPNDYPIKMTVDWVKVYELE